MTTQNQQPKQKIKISIPFKIGDLIYVKIPKMLTEIDFATREEKVPVNPHVVVDYESASKELTFDIPKRKNQTQIEPMTILDILYEPERTYPSWLYFIVLYKNKIWKVSNTIPELSKCFAHYDTLLQIYLPNYSKDIQADDEEEAPQQQVVSLPSEKNGKKRRQPKATSTRKKTKKDSE